MNFIDQKKKKKVKGRIDTSVPSKLFQIKSTRITLRSEIVNWCIKERGRVGFDAAALIFRVRDLGFLKCEFIFWCKLTTSELSDSLPFKESDRSNSS